MTDEIEWVLVPKLPTKQMLDAMQKVMRKMADERKWVPTEIKHLRRWNAAIASAPKPPAKIADIEELRKALQPFSLYYVLNDCHNRPKDDALEVPVSDLRRANRLVRAR